MHFFLGVLRLNLVLLLIWRLVHFCSLKIVEKIWKIKKADYISLQNWEFSTVKIRSRVSITYEPQHEISNNVVWLTSKGSDQPVHKHSLIGAFASRLNILWILSYWLNIFGVSKLKRRLHRLVWVYSCQNATLLEITCHGSYVDFSLYYYVVEIEMHFSTT